MAANFSAPVQTGPGAYQASYIISTRSFPGIKKPGRRVDHPTPSRAEVNERVYLYLNSPYGPSNLVQRWTLPFLTFLYIFVICTKYRICRFFRVTFLMFSFNSNLCTCTWYTVHLAPLIYLCSYCNCPEMFTQDLNKHEINQTELV
jgi:hypothetical protein